jgi:hypothetical protein
VYNNIETDVTKLTRIDKVRVCDAKRSLGDAESLLLEHAVDT